MNAAYVADPLVTSKLSPRWFTEMKLASKRVQDAAQDYTTPLLLMQGGSDPITCSETAKSFYDAYKGSKTVQFHQELYHELFNELERDNVIAQMISWLDQQATEAQ
jgi:alpha-beta hydrolase superfamily lysophospholipase